MVVENQIPELIAWLPAALANWALICVIVVAVAVVLGFLVATVQNGPRMALRKTISFLAEIPQDLVNTSFRRVWALSRLAVKESIRRRVVVGFAVFILLLLFAGWFLDPGSERPAQLYLDFVLTATGYLVLLLALFLSALSLPSDIRYKTLHTVVTKPVRPTEIVLGRIIGFAVVGTALLVVMGALSYLFVLRGLSHTHALEAGNLRTIGDAQAQGDGQGKIGYTDRVYRHRHEVRMDASGETGQVETQRGHRHELIMDRSDGETSYRVGSTEGMLQARVPVYGKLRFRSPEGMDVTEGINVGDEWVYRSYIQGASDAAAIWTFQGITEGRFPEGLPVEMTLGVFRTYKGDIEKGVLGSVSVRNPKTGLTLEVQIFESKEFSVKKIWIPRTLTREKFSGAQMIAQRRRLPDGSVEMLPAPGLDPSLARKDEYDLYKDLVADGTVEIWTQCIEPSQYFGAAQADLYLRASDAFFLVNFVKGYFGIWLQMLLVIGFGVMFSTFLSGPVAIIATLGALLGGFFSEFMANLGRGEVLGGGPFEALVRLVKQENLMIELNPGLGIKLVEMFDKVAEVGLRAMAAVLPPLAEFNFASFVAEGFNISGHLLAVRTLTMLGFLIPVFLAGYAFLKTREVAQ